jgi:hypothetical protein
MYSRRWRLKHVSRWMMTALYFMPGSLVYLCLAAVVEQAVILSHVM